MKALLLVDIQNDFLPGGALPVPEGHQIIPPINRLMERWPFLIIASKDWHPQDHRSFAPYHQKKPGDKILLNGLEQILWPVHCVQRSKGAEFAPSLRVDKINQIIYKGTDEMIDSYSIFFDNAHLKPTQLDQYLRVNQVSELYITGLATDYCVKYSVLDAISLGYRTFVVIDACRGINLSSHDVHNALEEMQKAGAILTTTQELLR